MAYRIDTGVIPTANYQQALAKSKRRLRQIGPKIAPMTERKAFQTYRFCQELNSVTAPELALKRKAFGQKKHGLI